MSVTVFPNGIAVGSPAQEIAPSNYLAVAADFSSATWNTVATHEILTVTGLVRVRIIPVCTVDLTGASATIALGVEGAATTFIAATTGTDIDAGEIWLGTTPAGQFAYSSVVDRVVQGLDIGYVVATAALTAGAITFHVWWDPLETGATVVAGAGGTL